MLGLSRNLLCTLQNIPTIVSIIHRGYGCECGIYVQLIIIDMYLVTKFLCGGGGRCNFSSKWLGGCFFEPLQYFVFMTKWVF